MLRAAAGSRAKLDFAPSQMALHDPPAVARVAQDEVVGRDQAADDGLAQSGAGVDNGLVSCAGDGIGGENHPGGVGGNQPLHDDGQFHRHGGEPVMLAVGDGAVAPEGSPAAADGVEQCRSSLMPRKVSCCPANAASGKSSAVALERTATAPPPIPGSRQDGLLQFRRNRRRSNSVRISAASAGSKQRRGHAEVLVDNAVVSGRGDAKPGGPEIPRAKARRDWRPCRRQARSAPSWARSRTRTIDRQT